jgi:hypothetical protein
MLVDINCRTENATVAFGNTVWSRRENNQLVFVRSSTNNIKLSANQPHMECASRKTTMLSNTPTNIEM